MGFKKSDNHSLFENPPTTPKDSMTMLTLNKKNPDSVKLSYSMITGDKRLSPNNKEQVKELIDDRNKNGKYIKVILISQAGSEGIDFKNIRQVHILEPWYNMNRLEQIFGRAVRNFSHKKLPFSKRNVKLFMHGTILSDKKEESADLYIYRIAIVI
jgi:superfamily II DNA or RNA helicase